MTATSRHDRFLELLYDAPVRLTSVPREQARARHVEDALAGLPHVAGAASIVDVGSGTGVPGIPLAIALPETEVHLVESVARKAAALAAIADAVGATNVRVHAARAEELGRGPLRDAFAIAVCRALAPPPVAVELCLPLVRAGGRLVIWSGAVDPDAVATAAAVLAGRVDLIAPVAGAERRSFVVVAKTGPTPAAYPRRTGMAAKRPLA